MTVAMVAVMGVLVLVLWGGAALASAVSAAHRARAAADLGALAGAAALEAGASAGEACARAGVLVHRNGARLTGCTAAGDGSLLVVDESPITLRLPGGGPDMAKARSRAGPSPWGARQAFSDGPRPMILSAMVR
jgi:secretion/DNA translocation related TadE-like protein